jgi:hypothetical protein
MLTVSPIKLVTGALHFGHIPVINLALSKTVIPQNPPQVNK